MAITFLSNGAGGSTGADMACLRRVMISGGIQFVGNAVATASDANPGTDRAYPRLTTAGAMGAVATGDTIVYLAGHNETISAEVSVSIDGLSFVGEGTGDSVPRLICGGAAINMFDVTGVDVLFDNLYFPSSTAALSYRIHVDAVGAQLNDLQFDSGANDTAAAVLCTPNAGSMRVDGCRFTSLAIGAEVGFHVPGGMAGLSMNRNTFDAGSTGWDLQYGFVAGGAITNMRVRRAYLLNGSDVLLPTGTEGFWQTEVATGSAGVNWTP